MNDHRDPSALRLGLRAALSTTALAATLVLVPVAVSSAGTAGPATTAGSSAAGHSSDAKTPPGVCGYCWNPGSGLPF